MGMEEREGEYVAAATSNYMNSQGVEGGGEILAMDNKWILSFKMRVLVVVMGRLKPLFSSCCIRVLQFLRCNVCNSGSGSFANLSGERLRKLRFAGFFTGIGLRCHIEGP